MATTIRDLIERLDTLKKSRTTVASWTTPEAFGSLIDEVSSLARMVEVDAEHRSLITESEAELQERHRLREQLRYVLRERDALKRAIEIRDASVSPEEAKLKQQLATTQAALDNMQGAVADQAIQIMELRCGEAKHVKVLEEEVAQLGKLADDYRGVIDAAAHADLQVARTAIGDALFLIAKHNNLACKTEITDLVPVVSALLVHHDEQRDALRRSLERATAITEAEARAIASRSFYANHPPGKLAGASVEISDWIVQAIHDAVTGLRS